MEPLNLDLAPHEEEVIIQGKKYILREASESATLQYRRALLGNTKIGPDGKPNSIDPTGAMEANSLLVSLCLYLPTKDNQLKLIADGNPDQGYLVSLATIRGWTKKVVKALFDRIAEVSDLNDREEKKVEEILKNGLPTGAVTSASATS